MLSCMPHAVGSAEVRGGDSRPGGPPGGPCGSAARPPSSDEGVGHLGAQHTAPPWLAARPKAERAKLERVSWLPSRRGPVLCSSMKAIISAVAGRAPAKTPRGLEDLLGTAQLTVLPPQLDDALAPSAVIPGEPRRRSRPSPSTAGTRNRSRVGSRPSHFTVALAVLGGDRFGHLPYCSLSQLGWVAPLRWTPVR